MSDNVNIIVQDTINEIVVNTAVVVETIDINVQVAVDEVNIIANPNNYVVNINRIIGEQVQSDWDQNDDQEPDYIKNKPSIPTLTSDLINDGEDGINPFITANDVTPQVNSDWNATSGVAEILNKPSIPSIAGLATVVYVDQQDALKVDKVAGSRLITSAESTLLGNTSGINTGDQDLSNLVVKNSAIVGATKTKITFDAKGLVTSGADATTADIADSLDKRYVTDANLTTIGNQSGVNTGDETITTIKSKLGITTLSGSNTGDQDLSGLTPNTRSISTTTPLQGGGDLSANRMLSILQSNTTQSGFLSNTDWNTFNGKFNLPALTIGSVLFSNGTTIAQNNANFFWDNTNNRLGIGTASPTAKLQIKAPGALSTDIALRVRNSADSLNLMFVNGLGQTAIGQGTATLTNMLLVQDVNSTSVGIELRSDQNPRVGSTFNTSRILSGYSSSPESFLDLQYAGGAYPYTYTTGLRLNSLGNILINTTTNLPSSKLTIESTTQGVLFPRMTTTQKNAIASPATGLVVFDTTLNKLCVRGASAWETITSV